jgi:hypothetical protein
VKVTQLQLKMIAIGLVPVYLFLAYALPKNTTTTILLGIVMFTGFVVIFIGMSMQKREPEEHDDLLAIPPKKS